MQCPGKCLIIFAFLYNFRILCQSVCQQQNGIINIIRTAPAPEIPVSSSKVNFTCNVTQEEDCKLVEKTKEYIIDGDIFQAVISRQFSTPYEGSLINPYRVLRTTNPSPYMVYLSIDGEEIMSTSPETLVRLENGRGSSYSQFHFFESCSNTFVCTFVQFLGQRQNSDLNRCQCRMEMQNGTHIAAFQLFFVISTAQKCQNHTVCTQEKAR